MTFWWENYNYVWCCIKVWNLASYADGRTEVEGTLEWGDEEDILIKHGGSERRMEKFA